MASGVDERRGEPDTAARKRTLNWWEKAGRSSAVQAQSQGPRTNNSRSISKVQNGKTQMHLDLGQKEFSSSKCPVCGMLYAKGQETDEKLHKVHHAQFIQGIKFQGWSQERVLSADRGQGRILMVLPSDPAPQLKKLKEICTFLEKLHGMSPGWLMESVQWKIFLYISSQKRVVGVVVAEVIKEAHPMAPPDQEASSGPASRSLSTSQWPHPTPSRHPLPLSPVVPHVTLKHVPPPLRVTDRLSVGSAVSHPSTTASAFETQHEVPPCSKTCTVSDTKPTSSCLWSSPTAVAHTFLLCDATDTKHHGTALRERQLPSSEACQKSSPGTQLAIAECSLTSEAPPPASHCTSSKRPAVVPEATSSISRPLSSAPYSLQDGPRLMDNQAPGDLTTAEAPSYPGIEGIHCSHAEVHWTCQAGSRSPQQADSGTTESGRTGRRGPQQAEQQLNQNQRDGAHCAHNECKRPDPGKDSCALQSPSKRVCNAQAGKEPQLGPSSGGGGNISKAGSWSTGSKDVESLQTTGRLAIPYQTSPGTCRPSTEMKGSWMRSGGSGTESLVLGSHDCPGSASVTRRSLPLADKSRSVKACCGVRFVWVSSEHRRRGLATRLLDMARSHLVHGYVVPRCEMAFSQPTEEGVRLAQCYVQSKQFLVYCV